MSYSLYASVLKHICDSERNVGTIDICDPCGKFCTCTSKKTTPAGEFRICCECSQKPSNCWQLPLKRTLCKHAPPMWKIVSEITDDVEKMAVSRSSCLRHVGLQTGTSLIRSRCDPCSKYSECVSLRYSEYGELYRICCECSTRPSTVWHLPLERKTCWHPSSTEKEVMATSADEETSDTETSDGYYKCDTCRKLANCTVTKRSYEDKRYRLCCQCSVTFQEYWKKRLTPVSCSHEWCDLGAAKSDKIYVRNYGLMQLEKIKPQFNSADVFTEADRRRLAARKNKDRDACRLTEEDFRYASRPSFQRRH